MSEPQPRSNLGEVHIATQMVDGSYDPRHMRNVILLLAGSVMLMMTGYGIIFPVFARRLGEMGAGVQALGLMTMAFALAQLIAAPVLGSMADRFGRRPLILLGLGAFVLANVGFLFAESVPAFLAVRVFEGALSAGLFPAAMGIVADVVPEGQRARWVGVVMGSYAAGFFFGPMLGGLLYDNWGYAMPFLASAVMGALGLVVAFIMVPETRTVAVRKRELLRGRRQADHTPGQVESLWASLPRPLYVLGTLLWVDFMIIFAFAFVDPQMIFFLYDELGWTTLQFGVVIAVYGLVAVLGQGFLGRLSDRVGRKPVIIAGTLLNASFYAGLVLLTLVESGSFVPMLLASIVAGLGEALVMPALSAAYMDITAEQHRSRVMGIKESAASLGGVLGPLLVVGASAAISSRGIFVIALVLTLATALVAALGLHTPQKALPAADDATQQYTVRRALVAQATLHGIVTSARQARIRQSNI